jgi:hypothetical protein
MVLTHRDSNRQGGTPTTAEIVTVTNYLNGRFVPPENVDYLPVMNPGLGRQIARNGGSS